MDDRVLQELKGITKGTSDYIFKDLKRPLYCYHRTYTEVFGEDNKYTLHTLRHYHATQLIEQGVNIKAVSKRLGHTSIQMTLDNYTHWLPVMDEEASKRVGSEYVV